MKICFPARKANGKDYSTLDEMMIQVGREPHGTWLAGTNGMWHGGIHISRESAPSSFLTPENIDTAEPLPFMVGGEVVAYRLNSQYLTDTWLGQTLQYSSTFVLVKSVCTPDPTKPANSLEFYSLYLGLTPPSDFPVLPCYQVTVQGNRLRCHHYSGQEKAGELAPAPTGKTLTTGQKVVVLRENHFGLGGHTLTFGLARLLNEHNEMTGNAFWVSVDPLYMIPNGKHTAHLPAWMQQAIKQRTYDAVMKPATRITVAAGDAVGFLGKDIIPGALNKTQTDPYVHIEVLSTDGRLPDFLRNAASVTSGEKYLHIHPESFLYTRNGDIFTKTRGKVRKDIHKILPQAKCPSFTDNAGKRWFDIGQGAWLSGDDVDADIGQYDLTKRGFSAFEQSATASMEKSLHENWVKSAFSYLSEWVRPERGIREMQVSNYYQALIRKMDLNCDGELSGHELHVALQYPEMDVRDLVAGLVIKHDSEWSGGSSHLRWTDYLKNMDMLLSGYVRTWLDKMEWMSQVPPFDEGKPVWHMHPVKFLDAIAVKDAGRITVSMLRKIWTSENNVSDSVLQQVADELNANLDLCHLNTEERLYHFMAQVYQETGPKFSIIESFDYSASRLPNLFLYYRLHPEEQLLDGRTENHKANQVNIANKAYGGRNGNHMPNDGWDYRGRGMKQLTGRYNYRVFTQYSSKVWGESLDFEEQPELVSSSIKQAVRSALFFWDRYELYKKADGGVTRAASEAITDVVNSGTDSRALRYNNLIRFSHEKIFGDVF
ncbi:hypothetical protein [Shimwellia blattae]|uniref:EF-hand domain-containing protein n=1 Tax=Shimwellia blattae (strain ATCC 29907 / DSM 4481 / JCM 1650 / NBRC 105725 / CDC 9005-74) TaxID=630626 RepID=I2B917_SHIBC|nr:hypothetical protein [Shimwellia blattae]AFJ47021.1 hypothetical protein EBL_c19290 [Shimwellia blattae DSM 4481 = NBRC 105725]GAB80856.1 hypothetical protein EB105725_10_00430 [Shimwellia blattae DSM 4481 = NBRC 105725]VDY64515.1 Predicted chitinase [Shimwellia blattae]VEC22623.1 Predicted chitinase [Shimwellia blattae]